MAETNNVEPDPETNNPHDLWEKIYSKDRICRKMRPFLSQDAPIKQDSMRFVCISDTHDSLDKLLDKIPFGDALIHCGDFTNYGDFDEILRFNDQIGKLPHKHKIVIAGNHELGFEDGDHRKIFIDERYAGRGTLKGYKMLTNCTYLQDNFVEICGIRIYGSSWHPLPGFSFYRARGQDILEEWLNIPTASSETPIDVLMTHTPPLGHSDQWHTERWGCTELLNCNIHFDFDFLYYFIFFMCGTSHQAKIPRVRPCT
uniref:Calcineurin-like phosphoesterase domain-containing protein n=1 Tax=Ditylenchus dipsaci TaxID=166011 RepID=A0A915EG83_9BILA